MGKDTNMNQHPIMATVVAVLSFGLQVSWLSAVAELPSRVDTPVSFRPWQAPDDRSSDSPQTSLLDELRVLAAQGRRDRAASPEFLDALDRLIARHAVSPSRPRSPETPSARLPFRPDFADSAMPAGWNAVNPSVWRFGNGEAVQTLGHADTRYVLFYEPGMCWRDCAATVRFESDAWFSPPANSCAALYLRYRGIADTYRIEWDGNGTLTLKSCTAPGASGERILARLPIDPAVVRDGQPWTVSVKGDSITVEHLGKRFLEVSDSSHREGTIGLESIHIPMHFRALEVVPR